MRNRLILAVLACVLMSGMSHATVVDSSSSGFTVKVTWTSQAKSDEVYRKLIRNVGDWWSSSHAFSGDAHNLSIEEKAMGCWCEKLPGGGVVRHMEGVYLRPGKLVRFSAGIG